MRWALCATTTPCYARHVPTHHHPPPRGSPAAGPNPQHTTYARARPHPPPPRESAQGVKPTTKTFEALLRAQVPSSLYYQKASCMPDTRDTRHTTHIYTYYQYQYFHIHVENHVAPRFLSATASHPHLLRARGRRRRRRRRGSRRWWHGRWALSSRRPSSRRSSTTLMSPMCSGRRRPATSRTPTPNCSSRCRPTCAFPTHRTHHIVPTAPPGAVCHACRVYLVWHAYRVRRVSCTSCEGPLIWVEM